MSTVLRMLSDGFHGGLWPVACGLLLVACGLWPVRISLLDQNVLRVDVR
jgi:hypothetical protein